MGGPGAADPIHIRAVTGYPIAEALAGRTTSDAVRIIDGGVMTGTAVAPDAIGLQAEATGLTLVPEYTDDDREMLGFFRLGMKKRSYTRCFVGTLRSKVAGPSTTALRGEVRPCVSCGACEEVCPAGLMPYLIHKSLYRDDLEEAELSRIDLCVECGLCSFVCPSKIELRGEFMDAKDTIRTELHVEPEADADADAEGAA